MKITTSEFLLKDISPQSKYVENIRQITIQGHSTKYLTCISQKSKVFKNQKLHKTVTTNRSLRRHDNELYVGS